MSKSEKHYKTYQIWIKKGHRMYSYFEQMCVNAKNMYNTTNFYIRQVYTGLRSEKELQRLQKEVWDAIEKHLPKMNDVRLAAYIKKVEKEKAKPKEKRKEVTCNLFEPPTADCPYVDYHFLDALFKSMAQNDYRALPTQCSQSVMKLVFQNWKSLDTKYETVPFRYIVSDRRFANY
jgi:putative transposase